MTPLTESPERTIKPLGRELTARQELACALRILAREGWQENLTGHITWVSEEGSSSFLCNPWGIWWEETTASDIALVATDGTVLEGEWPVSSAVFIHTELHRVRSDAVVIVHGHPYYATLLGCLGVAPEILHQNSSIFSGELAFVDEYDGVIDDPDAGVRLARRIGDATGVVLANHGAIATGRTIAEACYQAVMLERTCRFFYDALVSQQSWRVIDPEMSAQVQPRLKAGCPPVYWNGAVRQLLRTEPEVLS